jgi:predicted SAM-dependent methyltransferase
MIQAATVDEIYSAHAMEHLSPNNAYTILGEFQRVLKPGGKMHHVTPDFDSMVKLWNDMSNVYNTELGAFDYERYITICNGVLCPWDGVMANYPGHKSLWGVDVAQFLLKRWGFEDTFAKVEGTDLHFGGSTPKGIYNMIRA